MKVSFLKKSLKARDLPDDWKERDAFEPDEDLTVWIEPEDVDLAGATSLQELMDIIGKRAEQRGLTEERLDAILDEQ